MFHSHTARGAEKSSFMMKDIAWRGLLVYTMYNGFYVADFHERNLYISYRGHLAPVCILELILLKFIRPAVIKWEPGRKAGWYWPLLRLSNCIIFTTLDRIADMCYHAATSMSLEHPEE